jgi:hypothetical protein
LYLEHSKSKCFPSSIGLQEEQSLISLLTLNIYLFQVIVNGPFLWWTCLILIVPLLFFSIRHFVYVMSQINIDLYGNNVWFYLYILYVRDYLGDVTVASSVVDPGFEPSLSSRCWKSQPWMYLIVPVQSLIINSS